MMKNVVRHPQSAPPSLALVVFFLAAFSLCASALAGPMTFVPVSPKMSGIAKERHCAPHAVYGEPAWIAGGAVAEDFNGDGLLDLFFSQSGFVPCSLYMNQGGLSFVDEASSRGAAIIGDCAGAAAADYDNDGDIDIALARTLPPHVLLVNDGTGNFSANYTMLPAPAHNGSSPSWFDANNDGLLDLAIGQWANYTANLFLYQNRGHGLLTPYQYTSPPYADRNVFGARFHDINGDRWSDMLVVSDFGYSQVYINVGEGFFVNRTAEAGTGYDENGMGNAVGDYDNDGDMDWFVSSIWAPDYNKPLGNRLYRNQGNGVFDDVTFAAGVEDGAWGWGASFGDLDLDGDLDIYHVNGWVDRLVGSRPDFFDGDPARLFENLGDGTFAEVAASAGADDPEQGRGVILADFDNDGDLDIFINNNQVMIQVGDNDFLREQPAMPGLYRNDTASGNRWLKVTAKGTPPFHRDGIGSRVHVLTPDGVSQMRDFHASTNFMAQEPGRIAHFGLGTATMASEVRVEWVNGDATVRENVLGNRSISLPSPSGIVSKRRLEVDRQLRISTDNIEPADARREWIVEGETISEDPLEHAFDTVGPKEIRLNLYNAATDALLRSELYRVEVIETIGASGFAAR